MKNKVLQNLFTDEWYNSVKWKKVEGRYITNSDLKKVRKKLSSFARISEIGKSVLGNSIYNFQLGSGKIKILAWSQMHGNESTTTKAVFDLLNAFRKNEDHPVLNKILKNLSIQIIPILNPDGAKAYTRVNANRVDLNRDFQKLNEPESTLLKLQYNVIRPDFCLNLHDQRTIFSAGNSSKPAVLSFLTPAKDEERNIDDARKESMGLISGIAEDLKEQLPGMIGRYDDGFNLNCAGDTFQNLSTPTLLFEAGHYPEDYNREKTRKFVFRALISCLYQIAEEQEFKRDFENYTKIPENKKLFNDVIIRQCKLDNEIVDIAIQYKEVLKNAKIKFEPYIEKIDPRITNYGHKEFEGEGRVFSVKDQNSPTENVVVNKFFLNNEKIMLS